MCLCLESPCVQVYNYATVGVCWHVIGECLVSVKISYLSYAWWSSLQRTSVVCDYNPLEMDKYPYHKTCGFEPQGTHGFKNSRTSEFVPKMDARMPQAIGSVSFGWCWCGRSKCYAFVIQNPYQDTLYMSNMWCRHTTKIIEKLKNQESLSSTRVPVMWRVVKKWTWEDSRTIECGGCLFENSAGLMHWARTQVLTHTRFQAEIGLR
jgi:hypothetical protein